MCFNVYIPCMRIDFLFGKCDCKCNIKSNKNNTTKTILFGNLIRKSNKRIMFMTQKMIIVATPHLMKHFNKKWLSDFVYNSTTTRFF